MEKFILKNGQEVLIRPLFPEDVDAVEVYLNQMATETIFTNQYVGRPFDKEKCVASYESKNNLFLGAFDENNRVIAVLSLVIEKPDHPWLFKNARFGISMLKEFYGQGLGSYLMDLMELWAKEKCLHSIRGEVRSTNIRAIGLYLKQGFEICGHLKETALINNQWHDEYIISKIIKE